jgi:hypothetical protein
LVPHNRRETFTGESRHGMTNETFKDIEKIESDLWEAADNLRANSKLTSSDYFMPVLGVIFLRHAANRFEEAARRIEADQARGKTPKRKVLPADYLRRRALWLPESAHPDLGRLGAFWHAPGRAGGGLAAGHRGRRKPPAPFGVRSEPAPWCDRMGADRSAKACGGCGLHLG